MDSPTICCYKLFSLLDTGFQSFWNSITGRIFWTGNKTTVERAVRVMAFQGQLPVSQQMVVFLFLIKKSSVQTVAMSGLVPIYLKFKDKMCAKNKHGQV